MSRVLPILFNTDMVQAILEGRKTVTRRIIKKDKLESILNSPVRKENLDIPDERFIKCLVDAPFQKGDILYVRETYGYQIRNGGRFFCYRADNVNETNYDVDENGSYPTGKVKWHPSIHMPKAAARIWLKITDVRVERLQNITGEQAIKEGIKETFPPLAIDNFRDIWNSTVHKKQLDTYGWESNCWVWVIEFERCEKPE